MIKVAVDSEHTKPWLAPLGKLVANFGVLELFSYQWIAKLGGQPALAAVAKDLFAKRVGTLKDLLHTAKLPHPIKVTATKLWDEALQIGKERNAILHNPIVFGYSTAGESGPPDFIGVPDFKTNTAAPKILAVASLADINALINRIYECGTKLHDALFAIRKQST